MKKVQMYIIDHGDESVGTHFAVWDIVGDIYLEDDERDEIRQAFKEAFETITENPVVYFSDVTEGDE